MLELKEINVIELLREKIAENLKIQVERVDPARNLEEIGLSSLMAVIISGELEDELEIEIDPMIMFESKTINEIAEKIMQLNNG